LSEGGSADGDRITDESQGSGCDLFNVGFRLAESQNKPACSTANCPRKTTADGSLFGHENRSDCIFPASRAPEMPRSARNQSGLARMAELDGWPVGHVNVVLCKMPQHL